VPSRSPLRIACWSLLGLALAGPASALGLVPETEGEVDTGLGAPLGGGAFVALPFSVTSLTDSGTGLKSYLFVDKAGTANTYGPVSFRSVDGGTSDPTGDYWFRPSVVRTPELEDGQLEAGTFLLTFDALLPGLLLRLFDTEHSGTSYAVNGGAAVAVPAGANGNIHEVTLFDVSTLTLDLGERHGTTGDGVNFQLVPGFPPVPEPGPEWLGLAALLALAAGRRRGA